MILLPARSGTRIGNSGRIAQFVCSSNWNARTVSSKKWRSTYVSPKEKSPSWVPILRDFSSHYHSSRILIAGAGAGLAMAALVGGTVADSVPSNEQEEQLATMHTHRYSEEPRFVSLPGPLATSARLRRDSKTIDMAHFQIAAALEVKEEMEKVRLAQIIYDLHHLATEKETSKKGSLRGVWSKISSMAGKAQESSKIIASKRRPTISPLCTSISLDGVDLDKLTPDTVRDIVEAFQAGGRMDHTSLLSIISKASEILKKEPTLIDLRATIPSTTKFTVVGDLHGSLPSLSKVLTLVDWNDSDSAVIFDGDFVDRGDNSLEVLCILLLLKLCYGDRVVLLRGNHEDTMVASAYGFRDEVSRKYYGKESSQVLWDELANLFAALPIGALTRTAVVLHGGLPSLDFHLDQLAAISPASRSTMTTMIRPRTDEEKLICSILWSDPCNNLDLAVSKNPRGLGILFGWKVAQTFLKNNGLQYLIRGHELAEKGLSSMDCGQGLSVATVFSAASYPAESGSNDGAILVLDDTEGEFFVETYTAQDTLASVTVGAQTALEKAPLINAHTPLSSTLEERLRLAIGHQKSKLNDCFDKVQESNGLVTIDQWVNVMSENLTFLPSFPWRDLQPELAPTVTRKSSWRTFWHRKNQEWIDWKEFLESYSISYGGVISSDAETINQNRDKLIAFFRELDKDGNGSLNLDEFEAGVAKLNKTLPREKQLTNIVDLFNALDLDHNGEISFEEFEQGCSASNNNSFGALVGHQAEVLHECREMLLTVFKFLDADGSGTLSEKEFEIGVRLLNRRLPEERQLSNPQRLFHALDLDGNGEVSFDEFKDSFRFMAVS